MKEVEECLCVAVNTLLTNRNVIKSITSFEWIKNAISDNRYI